HPALGHVEAWSLLIVPIGAVTMVAGALFAVFHRDLKKVLAYTTISGLGTITLLIGVGESKAMVAALVFLVAHALYKASLFMVAGAVEHAAHTRDIGELRGLFREMPRTGIAMALAALSMAGLPPAVGFVAKETLIAGAGEGAWPMALIAAAVVSSALTMLAAWRAAVRPLFGEAPPGRALLSDGPLGLWLGALVLAAGSLVIGITVPAFQKLVGAAAEAA